MEEATAPRMIAPTLTMVSHAPEICSNPQPEVQPEADVVSGVASGVDGTDEVAVVAVVAVRAVLRAASDVWPAVHPVTPSLTRRCWIDGLWSDVVQRCGRLVYASIKPNAI